MRFANFSRNVSPRKHFLAGRLPRLHHIVERETENRQLFHFFISAAESALAGIAALVPVGSAPELSRKRTAPQLSCRACGTYRRGLGLGNLASTIFKKHHRDSEPWIPYRVIQIHSCLAMASNSGELLLPNQILNEFRSGRQDFYFVGALSEFNVASCGDYG
jgi:hypothetical protein